ncbi:MAG: hypothetical protein ACO1SX_17185 [Actinomycetota bacterium]
MRPFMWMLVTLTCLTVMWGNALLREPESLRPASRRPLVSSQTTERETPVIHQPAAALRSTPAPGPVSSHRIVGEPDAGSRARRSQKPIAKRAPLVPPDARLAAAPLSAGQAVDNARRVLATPARSAPNGDVLVQGSTRLGETTGSFSVMFNRTGCYLQEVEGPITVAAGFDGHASWALAATAARGYSGADITLPEGLIAVLSGRWAAVDGPYTLQSEAAEPGAAIYTVRLTPKGGGEPFFVDLDRSTWLPRTAYWIQSGERDTWALSDYRRKQGVMLPHRLVRIRGAQTDAYNINRVSPAPAFTEDPYRPASLRLARIRPQLEESGRPGGMRG